MKTKYEILNFNSNELDILENHLNEMAQKHWHLKWMSTFIICYEYNEEEIHYYIDYNKFSSYKKTAVAYDETDENELNHFYEELGYYFVCSFDQYSIYESKEMKEKIHTDEVILKKESRNTKIRSLFTTCLLPLFTILPILWITFASSNLVLHYSFTYYFQVSILFILIALYMGIHSISIFKLKSTHSLKFRSVIHLTLLFIQSMILLYLYYIETKINSFPSITLIYVLYYSITFNYIFSFSSNNKKYRNIRYITYYVPYIITAIILIAIPQFTNRNESIWYDHNENYPQTFVDLSSFDNDLSVYHYVEKESSFLTLIECRMIDEDESGLNFYYYNDKKELLHKFIMEQITVLNEYHYIDSINEYDIYSEDKNYYTSEKDDEYGSYLLIVKENEYFKINTKIIFTKDELKNFITKINWQN